jgi:hypothetical protein
MRDGTQEQWRFERQSPDSLTLSRHVWDGEETRSVPWSVAERVDLRVSDPPSARRILVGSVVGGLVGLAVSYIGANQGPCNFDHGSCPGLGFAIAMPEIVASGMFGGGTVGYFTRHHHWSTVWRASAPPASPDR